jgi:parallel beta-helix repeat protein
LLATKEYFNMRACSTTLTVVAVIALLSSGPLESAGRAEEPLPRKDIQSIFDRAQAGSTLILDDGVYKGGLFLRASGTAASPIIVKARNPHKAIIRGGPGAAKKGEIPRGLTVTGSYVVLDSLRIEDAPGDGIFISGKRVTVRSCVLYHNGWGVPKESFGGAGVLTAGSADDVRLEGNTSYENREHGVYVGGGAKRPIIIGNTLYRNGDPHRRHGGSGLQINADGPRFPTSGAVIRANKAYGNHTMGISLQGVHDSLIVNNLLYDNHHYAALGVTKASKNDRFFNNTIVTGEEKGGNKVAILIMGGDKRGSTSGHKFYNNILVAKEGGAALSFEKATYSDVTSDHNLFLVGGRRCVAQEEDKGGHRWTLADWQALGHDSNSRHADPRFVEHGRDFHLKGESPARGLGVALEDVKDDLDKVQRSKENSTTAGAYELSR